VRKHWCQISSAYALGSVNMNYEVVYQTLKAKLQALVPNANVRLPNEPPAKETEMDIDVSVTEVDTVIHTEEKLERHISIDILLSVPIGESTARIHNIASRVAAAFNPVQGGSFWAGEQEHWVIIRSAGQRRPNMTDTQYQINVRILAIIYT